MIKPSEINSYLDKRLTGQYSRDNFDLFLREIDFKFTRPAVHITGTNGKGSVAYYMNQALIDAKYRVGRFISPSLHNANEMITINNKMISDLVLADYINRYDDLFSKYNLTAFEIITFIALEYFSDKKVDIAIIEVGMGGKIDATNIFKPILSIITNVSIEHTSYLGKTIKEIAEHKAGIIKAKVPVLLGPTSDEAFTVIANHAIQLGSPIYVVKPPENIRVSPQGICFDALVYKDICLSIPAQYEATNATIALNALEILAKKYPIEPKVGFAAFKSVQVPARFSIVHENPLVIIDGAHNPAGMAALLNSVKALNHNKLHVVFAAFKDKDVAQEFNLLALSNANVIVTTFQHPRARLVSDYQALTYPFVNDYKTAIRQVLKVAKANEVVVITGSLHFAMEVYEKWEAEFSYEK